MNYHLFTGTGPRRDTRRIGAFSLVEALAVVSIMVLAMSLLMPAVSSMLGNAGRRGAIDQLIGTFDQARVAALRNASKVYIGFADSTFPDPEKRYRSYIVFRPRLDTDEPPAGAGASPYVILTKWRKLPQGISIKSESNSLVGATGSTVTVKPTDSFPGLASGTIPVIGFNSSGGVSQPANSNLLRLFIYEGFYEGGRDVLTQPNWGGFDVISVARFTGRPRMEVLVATP